MAFLVSQSENKSSLRVHASALCNGLSHKTLLLVTLGLSLLSCARRYPYTQWRKGEHSEKEARSLSVTYILTAVLEVHSFVVKCQNPVRNFNKYIVC